jgi:hypothetical protein
VGSMARLAHHCSAGSSPVRIGFASDRAVITRAARPDAVGGDRCCPDRSGVGVTAEQTATVDARIAPSLVAVSWNHCKPCWRRREADPDGAEQQAAAAAQERFVRLGRGSEHGLKLIIARAAAGDAIWFKATIDRIADILTRHGDDDPVDIRRSKAIGILAQPAEALRLLCQHQNDDWDGSANPMILTRSQPRMRPIVITAPLRRMPTRKLIAAPTPDWLRISRITPPPFDPSRAPRRHLCASQRGGASRRQRCSPGRRRQTGTTEPAAHAGQTRIGSLGPISVTTTGSRPSAAGRSDNPNPAAGYGDHPTAAST